LDTIPDSRTIELGKEVLIWRLSSFSVDEMHIDTMIEKARGFKTLILDLRDNSGGYVEIEKRLAGSFFQHDLKIGERKSRKESKPVIAKNRGSSGFSGNLIILIDHDSASASEVLARIVQLEKRGKVIGDRSAGAVMMSRFFVNNVGVGNTLYFGVSVTVSDFIMPDGKSLEKVGVTPDEIVVPTAADLANHRDPVLSYAASLAGVELEPQKAGTYFPIIWTK
jgi:carboxyl-terminal processing protease